MLLTARENDVHIGDELNNRTDEGISTYLRIITYLLKLVDGQIALFSRLLHILKHLLQGVACFIRFYSEAERRQASKGIGADGWPKSCNEIVQPSLDGT